MCTSKRPQSHSFWGGFVQGWSQGGCRSQDRAGDLTVHILRIPNCPNSNDELFVLLFEKINYCSQEYLSFKTASEISFSGCENAAENKVLSLSGFSSQLNVLRFGLFYPDVT